MIVGVLSDTHLSRPGQSLLDLLSGPLGCAEVVVHAGDHVGEEIVDHLEFVDGRPYHGVAGNTDPPSLLRRLGSRKVVELGGMRIGLVHGWGATGGLENRVAGVFGPQADVVVFGHSHIPLVERRGPLLLVNPGSPFTPRGGSRGSVALIHIQNGAARAEIVEV